MNDDGGLAVERRDAGHEPHMLAIGQHELSRHQTAEWSQPHGEARRGALDDAEPAQDRIQEHPEQLVAGEQQVVRRKHAALRAVRGGLRRGDHGRDLLDTSRRRQGSELLALPDGGRAGQSSRGKSLLVLGADRLKLLVEAADAFKQAHERLIGLLLKSLDLLGEFVVGLLEGLEAFALMRDRRERSPIVGFADAAERDQVAAPRDAWCDRRAQPAAVRETNVDGPVGSHLGRQPGHGRFGQRGRRGGRRHGLPRTLEPLRDRVARTVLCPLLHAGKQVSHPGPVATQRMGGRRQEIVGCGGLSHARTLSSWPMAASPCPPSTPPRGP